jgi:hypothetical protein
MANERKTTEQDSSDSVPAQKGRAPYRKPEITLFGPVARMTGSNAAGSIPDAVGQTMGGMAMMM